MKTIKITISGTKSILLHNPSGMGAKNPKGLIPTPEQEAAASCYWMSDKSSLMFPSQNIHRAIVIASRAFKAGKRGVAPYIAGGVEIAEEEVPFGTKEYVIDTRRAVIQRQGVLRSRAKLAAGWKLSFNLLVNETDIPQQAYGMLRSILEEAGRRVGIGDYRVEKGGPFGKFQVAGWEEQS